eukprot:Hpha_TRINITY_DN2205_c0_g1::TRINITY_DN2205_c0_g1_i2::g.25348::m.25348
MALCYSPSVVHLEGAEELCDTPRLLGDLKEALEERRGRVLIVLSTSHPHRIPSQVLRLCDTSFGYVPRVQDAYSRDGELMAQRKMARISIETELRVLQSWEERWLRGRIPHPPDDFRPGEVRWLPPASD